MGERTDIAAISRVKLTWTVLFTSMAMLVSGASLYLVNHGSKILSFIFICTGLITIIFGLVFIFILIPRQREKQKKNLEANTASLADLCEWLIAGVDPNFSVEKSVDKFHDQQKLPDFLENSPLKLSADSVDVFADQVLELQNKSYRVAYALCENLSFDKRIPVFEGWILHGRDLVEDRVFIADHNKHNMGFLIGSAFLVILGYGFIGFFLSHFWAQLTKLDLLIGAILFIIANGVASLAYAKTFTRPSFAGTAQTLPARYKALYSSLLNSPKVKFFRIVACPAGLIVAVEPSNSSMITRKRDVVPVEGPHGAALEAILEPIKNIQTF